MAANSSEHRWSFAELLRWVGLIGIAAIAVLRCLILLAPQRVFDVDQDPIPLAGLGAPGSMVLDVLLLLSCVAALIGEWRSGRGIDWLLLALAFLPMPIIMWHGERDAGDLWRGSTGLAATVACATVAHLARDRHARIVLIALLLATVAPMLARGASQVTYEHANSVRYYGEHKAEILASHGWAPDSSAVRIYERRLFQPQPTGWFATSNIFASLAAFGLIMWIGLALAATRAGMQSGWIGAMVLCAIVALAGLILSGSKGAILAVICGAVVPLLDRILVRRGESRAGALAAALVLLALVGVAVRGAVLPEGFLGEKSLLFRWHYTVASAGIVADHPLTGVGSDEYQTAYMQHRPARSPEEVASAHSMFWDWLCALGVSGAAWIALVLLILWRSRRSAEDVTMEKGLPRAAIVGTLAIIALAMIPALVIEWPTLDGAALIVRLLGILGFAAVAWMSASIMNLAPLRLVSAAVIAAVAALVIHGQIEMTFHQPGSVVWAMCAVGLLASARTGTPRAGTVAAVLAAVGLIGFAAWLCKRGVFPALAQQRVMLAAAEHLPSETQPSLEQRRTVSDRLVQSYELWPLNVHPLEAAAIQLETAAAELARDQHGEPPVGLLMQAQDIVERAVREHGKPSSMAIAISIDRQLAHITGDREHWIKAIALARRMTELDPNGLSAWRRFGDVLWDAGERAEAAKAYERTLQCDANFELDKEKQFSAEQREELKSRVQGQ